MTSRKPYLNLICCTFLTEFLLALSQQSDTLSFGEGWNSSITVSLSQKSPLSSILYGIFFEEIGHAGEGGLYAELIQDRSFDAVATATGFFNISSVTMDAELVTVAHSYLADSQGSLPKQFRQYKFWKSRYLEQLQDSVAGNQRDDIVIAWQALPGTTAALSREKPLNAMNTVSMELTTGQGTGGVINTGYWGVSLVKETSYTVSLYLRSPQDPPINVSIALLGNSSAAVDMYAEASLCATSAAWQRCSVELVPSETDHQAQVAVLFRGPGTLAIDMVSMFPTENVRKGSGHLNPWPFRQDLLEALRDLRPGFLRFPGGCYVEGDWLRNAFRWKHSVGRIEERPGHYNLWGYWSTDGLGLFEYMLLAEELGAEPVWVINNGVAHGDSVQGSDIWPWVQDALDSIEFITGPPHSRWGSVRAAMGRRRPWTLNYMAIGNEDCGKPMYVNNYLAFFGAISARYPRMRLIANCDMQQDAPTDLWDWHIYTHPQDMFNKRNEFNGRTPQNSHYIFASEYAVTEGGGWGNLIGAVSEAAFMTGLERNSGVVQMAAYAPLFVHTNNRPWPTNLIVFDNHRWYGIPSYYVQQLFREVQGTHYLGTVVRTNPATEVHEDKVAASATCQSEGCEKVALKLINFSSYNQLLEVQLEGATAVGQLGRMVTISGQHPEDENTFANPTKVHPETSTVHGLSNKFYLSLKPWSVNALMLQLSSSNAVI